MLNAPFCWVGGKNRLRGEIIKRLPHHTCYVEVFGGAGWVLFGKNPSVAEVYNDIDGELVNFFRVVKNCHRAFVLAFDWLLVSRRIFHDYIHTHPDDLDEIQRAVRFYYIIQTSFASKWDTPSFGYAKTGGPGLNLENLYEKITGIYKRLRHVYIEEGSFSEVIARYDGPETCFFLDPPYYQVSGGYRHNLVATDYAELIKTLKGIEGKFLLTINDHPDMRNLFADYVIEEVEVPYSISRNQESRGRYGELMIRNYKGEGQMSLEM